MTKSTRLQDLAKAAGLSTATISRALNDNPNVNQETKKRVWRLAQELNYSFRPHMPAVLSGASSTIVIVIPMQPGRDARTADPFYLELIGGVSHAAREVSSDVLISHLAPKNYDDLSNLVAANRADGVIFLGQSFLHERFNRLAEDGNRFVVWGAELPGQQYCSVGSDNVKGGQKATNHLLRLGHDRIVFIGDLDAPEIAQRFQGYQSAMSAAGKEVDQSLVISGPVEIEAAESAVDGLFASGTEFDAVFAASDLIAVGAIRAIRRAGRKVPSDIAVVGYDNIQIARYSSPPLTTISQDMAKAGRLMVSKLLNAASTSNTLSERLPTDLIVRDSCGS